MAQLWAPELGTFQGAWWPLAWIGLFSNRDTQQISCFVYIPENWSVFPGQLNLVLDEPLAHFVGTELTAGDQTLP